MKFISAGSSRSLLLSSLLAVLSIGAAPAQAQQAAPKKDAPDTLEEVVVTGSLIPQLKTDVSTPVVTVTNEDMALQGFSSVADALQRSVVATGAVQGPQFVNGFTPGAQTISMFGLSPSYTKFLIDGRPIADYPALYNGTDIVVSIDGIPQVAIDHVDILPGGQSSIYGSDAIAGVVNISLKKRMDGPEADVRFGWTKDGGGTSKRVGLADGINVGDFNFVFGGQYEKVDPIWGYQRPLTNQYFAGGASAQTAERDWLVLGLFGDVNGNLYYMTDPNNPPCGNTTSQFGGTTDLRTRANRGQYCGTFTSGYATINNGTENEQAFLHGTWDISANTRLFADVLLDHDVTEFNTGTVFFGTADDSTGPFYYFYDPNVTPCTTQNPNCDLLNVQRIFSPEEAGNFRGQSNKDTKNSVRATIGLEGRFGASDWRYALDMTYTENKLIEATHLAFTQAITNFFAPMFGPNLGPDPIFGQPTYAVDWAQFYKPITPADYASFTGYATSWSRTEESLARGQVTNTSLFSLPGGKAGLALVVEGGAQGWDYAPDPRFLNGETYLYTATAGSGHRSRMAGTFELRLPVLKQVTVGLSDRFDDYRVSGEDVTKDTYNLSVEYKPIKSLMLRGRYGTSFKAPTLSDEYQGTSGFFQTVTDYYTCTKNGYTGANLGNCPQFGESVFGTTSGNTKLRPITAKNWDLGLVWNPVRNLQINYDVMHWQITNEVAQQDSDQLLRTESACLLGQLDPTSPTCVNAVSLVTRDANGLITQISTPKINVAREDLTVGVLEVHYAFTAGKIGEFRLGSAWTDSFKHKELKFAGDTVIDLLNSPFYSTDFKSKANFTGTWSFHNFDTTLFVERYGRTPNYAAQQTVDGYAAAGAARLEPWTIANMSLRYQWSPSLEVIGNVNNLFNKLPPLDSSTLGTVNVPFSVFNYNNYGRAYFVGANYHFGK
ncbi:MAG: TonB-dependent receptor [Proteobacteria bacterium]|nr:TonB-dependent receptor [Pseudomonadota bacterium]